ncbi:MAG: FAD:protein FMN transferase [Kiritimatiellae bacterium]|nr:FAD:protein FMN transferase [Kiritimatiellia bacterium]
MRFVSIAAIFIFMCPVLSCTERKEISRVEWSTMGTIAAVQTKGKANTFVRDSAKEACDKVVKLFNRHDNSSEIRQKEKLSDSELRLLGGCWQAAFEFKDATKGAFNPRWRGSDTLDFGGIAKGYAVDLAYEEVKGKIEDEVLIDIGGNLRAVKGDWKVVIAGSNKCILLKESFACATSAEYFRGKHIYDGRTGKVVENNVESVTVVAPLAMHADALSTAFFVLGPNDALVSELCNKYKAEVYWMMKK